MAFEALNNAARLKSNLVIVLNDNQMSISKNVGGMSKYLGNIRTSTNYTELKEDVETKLRKSHIGNALADSIKGAKDAVKRLFVPGMLFEDMGITYIGPIDGHDVKQMVSAFESASKMQKAVIVHVCTKKGKGYLPAEEDPSAFHGIAPFKPSDGTLKNMDNVALLMRQRKSSTPPQGRTRCSAWIRPVGTDAPGVYRLYLNGEEHPLPDDFCAQGGVLAYSLPDEHPHATTAHRQFSYVEPTQGGILLEHGDTPRKYTVYAIGTDGRMIVGDVTV